MSEEAKKFRYVKPYVSEKVIKNGEEKTPKLETPKFRDSFKASEVTWERENVNGLLAEVKFQGNYNKDGSDMRLLFITKDSYLVVTLSCQAVTGKQVMKRLMNVDTSKNVVLNVWKNGKGYANISVFQRDLDDVNEKGIAKKIYTPDAFADDDNLPEVTDVKFGKEVKKDHYAQVEYMKEKIIEWAEADPNIPKNFELIEFNGGGEDDGDDDK